MEPDIKSCPFCGGSDLTVGQWPIGKSAVACLSCDYAGPPQRDGERAVMAWNTRLPLVSALTDDAAKTIVPTKIRGLQALLGMRLDGLVEVDARGIRGDALPELQVWMNECLSLKLSPDATVMLHLPGADIHFHTPKHGGMDIGL